MTRPTLNHEEAWKKRGHQFIAGIDEAGRGPLAGPVCVAAVILPAGFAHRDLNDSKQLSEKKRERIYEELTDSQEIHWSVVMADAAEVDAVNILQATYAAMRRAALMLEPQPEIVLIDGRPVPNFPITQEAIVKGDSLSLSIAAASVIAKVTRDRFMLEAAQQHPHYGFEKHKGYGTSEHLAALRRHGPCPLHRRSFAPVAEVSHMFDTP
ncbi:MAG: ribonuclease HII [Verrucomicrobiaceae bacterium]